MDTTAADLTVDALICFGRALEATDAFSAPLDVFYFFEKPHKWQREHIGDI